MLYNTLGIGRITKVVADAVGVGAKRVVVYGDTENTVKSVAAGNADRLAGVTFDSGVDGGDVALAEYAYPEIEASGPIPYGTNVNVAPDGGDATKRGRIKAVNEAPGTVVTLVGITEEEATAEGQRVKVNIRLFGLKETV